MIADWYISETLSILLKPRVPAGFFPRQCGWVSEWVSACVASLNFTSRYQKPVQTWFMVKTKEGAAGNR